MPNTLTWHGHANFQVATDSANILIDPFFEGNPNADRRWDEISRPDLVLVTHDHGDHTGQVVELARQGAMVGCIVGTAQALVDRGVPEDRLLNGIGFNIGGAVEFQGIKITMIQAHHSSDSAVAVGYILTLPGGFVLYHSGDTGIFSEMELYGQLFEIDLSLLPIGGVFTMDPTQGALACKLLRTKAVTPMHWGTFPVLEQNTQAFKAALDQTAPGTSLVLMKPGETVTLDSRLLG